MCVRVRVCFHTWLCAKACGSSLCGAGVGEWLAPCQVHCLAAVGGDLEIGWQTELGGFSVRNGEGGHLRASPRSAAICFSVAEKIFKSGCVNGRRPHPSREDGGV